MFDFYVLCSLLYCILLLHKNYRQYLMRYIIYIYIRYSVYNLKKPTSQMGLAPEGFYASRSQEAFARSQKTFTPLCDFNKCSNTTKYLKIMHKHFLKYTFKYK